MESKNDFRIEMCTEVDLYSPVTVHRELGYIQYYSQYVDKPLHLRNEANNGKKTKPYMKLH